MSEEPERVRAPEGLRGYLSERDVRCLGCGYNLRSADTVRCPECGEVIPRPSAVPAAEGAERRWIAVWPVLFPMLPALCMSLFCAAIGIASAGRPTPRGLDPWLATLFALGAAGVGAAWLWWASAIERLEAGERRGLRAIAALVSVGLLVAAIAAL